MRIQLASLAFALFAALLAQALPSSQQLENVIEKRQIIQEDDCRKADDPRKLELEDGRRAKLVNGPWKMSKPTGTNLDNFEFKGSVNDKAVHFFTHVWSSRDNAVLHFNGNQHRQFVYQITSHQKGDKYHKTEKKVWVYPTFATRYGQECTYQFDTNTDYDTMDMYALEIIAA